MKTVLLVQKIGPYHHARFERAAAGGELAVVEYRPDDAVYAWQPIGGATAYARSQTRTKMELEARLAALRPDVLVCVGYADGELHPAMQWAISGRIPMVVCSDSTLNDHPRRVWQEALKRRIVGLFQAALVSGQRATDYLSGLGMPRPRIFRGWDVVDNDYFARGADASRQSAETTRIKLGLPAKYFLCVARFVPKKNLAMLIEAYARYRTEARSDDAWSLVILGSGPLEESLRSQTNALGLERSVHFPGFMQYPDLPGCYGLAGAFVLPSLSDQWGLAVNEAMAAALPVLVSDACGCVPDLVEPGKNGFTFDSGNKEELVECLRRIAALPDTVRTEMGLRSRAIVRRFSLATFATGLWAAVQCADARTKTKPAVSSRLLLAGLTRFHRAR